MTGCYRSEFRFEGAPVFSIARADLYRCGGIPPEASAFSADVVNGDINSLGAEKKS